jgi:hypothetical protein
MRKFCNLFVCFAYAVLFGAASVGCHAQVPPNPTAYTCPATTGTLYTPLNQSTPATGLTYTDSKPTAGQYCYIVESEIGVQVSLPSNTAGSFTTSGANSVILTWQAPSSGPTPAGYYLSRAPAVLVTLGAPTVVAGSVAEVTPLLPIPEPTVASVAPPVHLTARMGD